MSVVRAAKQGHRHAGKYGCVEPHHRPVGGDEADVPGAALGDICADGIGEQHLLEPGLLGRDAVMERAEQADMLDLWSVALERDGLDSQRRQFTGVAGPRRDEQDRSGGARAAGPTTRVEKPRTNK